jgi:hypothetical protein
MAGVNQVMEAHTRVFRPTATGPIWFITPGAKDYQIIHSRSQLFLTLSSTKSTCLGLSFPDPFNIHYSANRMKEISDEQR